MKVSAVGFLFEDKIKSNGPFKATNYSCTIHKLNPDGNVNRSYISSPVLKANITDVVSQETANNDILTSLLKIGSKKSGSKFKGATVKDGIKETEIHSMISDKLFAVRTKDEFGKNHFRILGRNKTKNLLSHNLYIKA